MNRHLRSLLQRFFRFSRHETPVGRGHSFDHRNQVPWLFELSHVSCSIRLITKRLLLLPTSQFRPSESMPYGLPAMPCAWRSDGLSTFHIIDHRRQRRRSLYAGSPKIPYGHLYDPYPVCARLAWKHAFQPINPGRSVLVDDASTALCLLSPYCPHLSPYSLRIRDRVSTSRLPPLSVHCREGFAPRHQRSGSTPL
jgi:hypothetical protein